MRAVFIRGYQQPLSQHTECGSNRAIFGRNPCFGARRGVRTAFRNPVHVTPPLNFSRPFEASGSLSSSARIQFLAEQFRGEAPIFHVDSLPVADAFQKHLATGEIANVRNPFGEIQNVEC